LEGETGTRKQLLNSRAVLVAVVVPHPSASDETGKSDSVDDVNRDDEESVDEINLTRYDCYIGKSVRKGFWIQDCVISLGIGKADDGKEAVLIHVVFDDGD